MLPCMQSGCYCISGINTLLNVSASLCSIELQKMNLPDKESGEVQGEASTGKKSTKKDSRDATLPEQKCKGKRRLVTDKV